MLNIRLREFIIADRGNIEINDLCIKLRLDVTALNKFFIILALMFVAFVMLLLVLLVNLLIGTDLNSFGGTWL